MECGCGSGTYWGDSVKDAHRGLRLNALPLTPVSYAANMKMTAQSLLQYYDYRSVLTPALGYARNFLAFCAKTRGDFTTSRTALAHEKVLHSRPYWLLNKIIIRTGTITSSPV